MAGVTRLRGAIVGLGAIARGGHWPRWRVNDRVLIVGAVEIAAPGPSDEATGLRVWPTLDALLAEEPLDFVDVCTPPDRHAELVEVALGRGLHVLCEKPLVVRRADMDRVARAADAGDRVLFTVHNWLHAPIVEAVSRFVRAGRVGRVVEATWTVERTGPSATVEKEGNWRLDPAVAGGGILVDHGWHALYVLLDWLGVRPERVAARLERRRHVDLAVEDTAHVELELPGARSVLDLTWAADRRRNEASVVGTEGSIRLLDDHLVLDGPRGETLRFDAPLSGGSTHPDWFDATAARFLDEVDGRSPRGANLAVATTCFCVLEAAWRSAADGGRPARVAD